MASPVPPGGIIGSIGVVHFRAGVPMEPEQAFQTIHARFSGVMAGLLTPRFRRLLEYMSLINALLLVVLLYIMHTNFVGTPGCAVELSAAAISEAQLIDIKVSGGWVVPESLRMRASIKDQSSFAEAKSSYRDGVSPTEEGQGDPSVDSCSAVKQEELVKHPITAIEQSKRAAEARRGPLGSALISFVGSWSANGAAWVERIEKTLSSAFTDRRMADSARTTAGSLGSREPGNAARHENWAAVQRYQQFEDWWTDSEYIYSLEKGFLMLSESAKARHRIRSVQVTICTNNTCFGDKYTRFLLDNLVGYDTVIINSLIEARGNKGYLFNVYTKELYNLNSARDVHPEPMRIEDYLVVKFGVFITSLFLFFTTTMSVSFTLRETQARMFKFTVQLQHHARYRLPIFRLIFTHIIESLVFVPIMIGILFFLFEFFDDQLMAFMILTLVWLCELFAMISVRTTTSMRFFPRFFFVYFMLFHIYFFSYTYGFSYIAFFATAAFIQHSVLYFWNRHEVPALEEIQRRQQQRQLAAQQSDQRHPTQHTQHQHQRAHAQEHEHQHQHQHQHAAPPPSQQQQQQLQQDMGDQPAPAPHPASQLRPAGHSNSPSPLMLAIGPLMSLPMFPFSIIWRGNAAQPVVSAAAAAQDGAVNPMPQASHETSDNSTGSASFSLDTSFTTVDSSMSQSSASHTRSDD